MKELFGFAYTTNDDMLIKRYNIVKVFFFFKKKQGGSSMLGLTVVGVVLQPS